MQQIPYKWYKILAITLVMYALVYGLIIDIPTDIGMLDETVRNLFYHVPMWFGMMLIMFVGWVYSMLYLVTLKPEYDIYASELCNSGILMGLAGLFTGMLWAYGTWGSPWTNDAKLNGVAVGMCMYGGYWLLQKSIEDDDKRARLSSVFNVFVFPLFIALIYVMPKFAKFSIHPGSGDTVNFKKYNMNGNMQMVFYPAVIGFTLLFVWLAELRIRIRKIKLKQLNEELYTEHIVTK